jgi:hypothetical protein
MQVGDERDSEEEENVPNMAAQQERRSDTWAIPKPAIAITASVFVLFVGGVSATFYSLIELSVRADERITVLERGMLSVTKAQLEHDREAQQWKYRIIGCESKMKSCEHQHDGSTH